MEPPFASLSQMGEKLGWHVFLRKTAIVLFVLLGQYPFTLDRLDGSHQSGRLREVHSQEGEDTSGDSA